MLKGNSPRYLPRKGTETYIRGNFDGGIYSNIRHDIYPARGRKLARRQNEVRDGRGFATIFTPQGDGNISFCPMEVVVFAL